MSQSLIQPNLHVTLIHYPIALLTLGVLIELFSAFWRRSGVRTAGRWMIVLGTLAAIPAITTGMYALRQTANPWALESDPWYRVVSGSRWTPQHWEVLIQHVRLTCAAGAILLLSVVAWLGSSDRARPRIYLLGMAVLLLSLLLISWGAHEGGELVYEHWTGVNMPEREMPLAETAAPEESVNRWIDPTELHLLLAGLAVAVVSMTVGLSIRRSAVAWENEMAETKAAAAGLKPVTQDERNFLQIPLLYPGRFWLVSGVLAVGTALAGIWVVGLWQPMAFYDFLTQKHENDQWRPVLHAIFAMSILLLIVLLGTLSRWFPRRRFFMGVLTTLLIMAVVLQVWTGVLMLFDSSSGPVTRFNRPPKAPKVVREMAPSTAPAVPATQPSPATAPAVH